MFLQSDALILPAYVNPHVSRSTHNNQEIPHESEAHRNRKIASCRLGAHGIVAFGRFREPGRRQWRIPSYWQADYSDSRNGLDLSAAESGFTRASGFYRRASGHDRYQSRRYNSQNDAAGNTDPAQSNEYVFVYEISGGTPVKKQVLQLPNTFDGLAWNPNGLEFYVSGGPDDDVHIFDKPGATWVELGTSPVTLGHSGGIGLGTFPPTAAGLAVTASKTKLVVANFENDSVSVVDLTTRTKIGELDLRPGKINAADQGVPGGEYPFWVAIKGSSKAYVSSIRDREIVVLNIAVNPPTLITLIHLNGKPNKMILNKAQTLLFAAADVTDTITEVDTTTDTVAREIPTTAPSSVFSNPKGFKGSSPNSLALSPDGNTLYVTNGGTNSVAVIRLAGGGGPR
jgi:DNA-binding beta-propeller fold protein YncE